MIIIIILFFCFFSSNQSNLQVAGLDVCLLPPHSGKTSPLYNLQDAKWSEL